MPRREDSIQIEETCKDRTGEEESRNTLSLMRTIRMSRNGDSRQTEETHENRIKSKEERQLKDRGKT